MGLNFSIFKKPIQNYEEPAQGISVEKKFDDAIIYNVTCACGTSEHSVRMWIEVNGDMDDPTVSVSLYADTYSPYFNNFLDRLKYAFKTVVFGQFKVEHCFLLEKQSALNFASAIQNQIEKFTNR